MKEIRYTLLTDGSSDRAIIPILNWLLRNCDDQWAIQHEWSDLRRLDKSKTDTLEKRIALSIELYPCEILFIHRDAEKVAREVRVDEIQKALENVNNIVSIPTVCIIPMRMTEAWLLFDVLALRKAAANPNGNVDLQLPSMKKIEDHPDPKKVLHDLLRQASELPPGRLKKFSVNDRIHRLADLIDDFSSLRDLPAFAALESDIREVLERPEFADRQ
jgi:Domain of unknown function (DUF4276)